LPPCHAAYCYADTLIFHAIRHAAIRYIAIDMAPLSLLPRHMPPLIISHAIGYVIFAADDAITAFSRFCCFAIRMIDA